MKDPAESVSQVVETLKKNPWGLSIREIAGSSGMNRMSVAKYLEVLMAKGIVEVRLFGSAKVYYLSRQIPVTTFIEYTTRHYCIMDSNLTVVQLNGWVPETVGMVYEDMINRPILEVLKGRVVNLDECRIAMEKALTGETSMVIVENRFKGKHMFFEIFHMPVQFPDGSCGVMAVCQDISEKKLLEIALRKEAERLLDLINNLPDIVFSVNPEGVLTYISHKVTEYGFVPGDLIGRRFNGMIVPEDRNAAMSQILSVRKSGTSRGIRFRAAVRDGRTIRFEADCMARRDASGTCTEINGTLRDVAAQVRPVPEPEKP
ncbi:MAG: PAS domain-containing protein [Methanoregula sp.]|nr:PAS domain-containing protein [Methanoregula sp.]